MSQSLPPPVKALPGYRPPAKFSAVRSGTLQRKCACGGTPGPTGECEECRTQRLQRQTRSPALDSPGGTQTPPIVGEVLRSPGQSLETSTRSFMESRFGHDFGGVRVHTDARASESARAVNALAYTVGRNIVFDAGHYAPQTSAGQRLLAHELTHVAQQTGRGALTSREAPLEAEAERASASIQAGGRPPVAVALGSGPRLSRQPATPEEEAAPSPEATAAAAAGFSPAVFVPGVAHSHAPTGKWADVQKDSSIGAGGAETLCATSSPATVLDWARRWTFSSMPLARKHLDHYRTGGGTDLTVDLGDVLRRDEGVRAVLAREMKTTNRGWVKIEQANYEIEDFQYAFGAIDRIDFDVNPTTGQVHLWFKDFYEFHPVGYGYSSFPDDKKRDTNCVHAAAVELKSSGAADYWMVGETVVPQSLFGGKYTISWGKTERDS